MAQHGSAATEAFKMFQLVGSESTRLGNHCINARRRARFANQVTLLIECLIFT
jgi:hypothetical protein